LEFTIYTGAIETGNLFSDTGIEKYRL